MGSIRRRTIGIGYSIKVLGIRYWVFVAVQAIQKESGSYIYPVPLLLKEWHTNKAHVYFDFQQPEVLWFLFSSKPTGVAYLTPWSRANFIELHRNSKYGEMVRNWMKPIRKMIVKYERDRRSMLKESHKQVPSRRIKLTGYQQYLIRKHLKKGNQRRFYKKRNRRRF